VLRAFRSPVAPADKAPDIALTIRPCVQSAAACVTYLFGNEDPGVTTGPVTGTHSRRNKEGIVDRRLWLKVAAGLSFFMAACQAVISVWPAAAAYFQAPPELLNDRVRLFVIGGAAALIPVLFGLYALSGAGVIRRLPLLRTALVSIGSMFLLRGLFIILTFLAALGLMQGEVSLPAVASHLVFLSAGIVFLGGAVLNWKALNAPPVPTPR
jgi:hypothetical protein